MTCKYQCPKPQNVWTNSTLQITQPGTTIYAAAHARGPSHLSCNVFNPWIGTFNISSNQCMQRKPTHCSCSRRRRRLQPKIIIKVRDNDNNHATAVPATATTTTPKLLWLPMVLMLLLWQVRWSRKRCGERQDGLGIQGAAINPRAPVTQIVDYWGK